MSKHIVSAVTTLSDVAGSNGQVPVQSPEGFSGMDARKSPSTSPKPGESSHTAKPSTVQVEGPKEMKRGGKEGEKEKHIISVTSHI